MNLLSSSSSQKNFLSKKKVKAFTLVELIVVITILAILGTVGIMSYQGISASARDSTRLYGAQELMKGLQTTFAKTNVYPLPDAPSVTLTYGTTTIGYQGYA